MNLKKSLLLSVFLLFVCNTKAQHSISTKKINAIDKLFSSYTDTPGCAIGVFKEGKILYTKGYGIANLDYNISITKSTVFETASISKQFTAACIILLKNEGKLKLNDPIQKYLPEIQTYKKGAITIDNLLHHTSGLRDYLALMHSKGMSWDTNFNNNKALELLSKQKDLNFKPGSKFTYSNTNYMLLSIIVERISGKTIGSFAKEKLFTPLKMNETFYYENSKQVIKSKAIGYQKIGDVYQREHFVNSVTTGDGGVYTTVEDLFKWNENFKTGNVGGKAFLEGMFTLGKLNNGNQTNYAGGLFLGDYYNLPGMATIGHSGSWAGFQSLFYKFTNQDVGFVILSNNESTNVWALLDELVGFFLEDEVKSARQKSNVTSENKQINKSISLSSKELEMFNGNYLNVIDGNIRKLLVENDTLIYQRATGRKTKLLPTSQNSFTFFGASQVKLTFEEKNKNTFSLIINDGPPIEFDRYIPLKLNEEQLKSFEGNYYNDELEVVYQIKSITNKLQILIEGEELVRLEGISNNIFRAEHFGYLKFNITKNGKIDGFVRNDDHVFGMRFIKRKS